MKHGRYSQASIALRRESRTGIRSLRASLRALIDAGGDIEEADRMIAEAMGGYDDAGRAEKVPHIQIWKLRSAASCRLGTPSWRRKDRAGWPRRPD